MSEDEKIQDYENDPQKVLLTKPTIVTKLKVIDLKNLLSPNKSSSQNMKENEQSVSSRHLSNEITKNNAKFSSTHIKKNASSKNKVRTIEEQNYIINLLKKNIQKRRNILPNLKLNIVNAYSNNINNIIYSPNKNSQRYFSTEENNKKKPFLSNYERYIKYNNHAHKLPKIDKISQIMQNNPNNSSSLNQNNLLRENLQNQLFNSQKIINTSTNTDSYNTRNLLSREMNSDNIFKNIEKNIEFRKKYIDMHNMLERIEECKKNKESHENNEKTEPGKRESETFFISGGINFNQDNLEQLKKELGLPSQSNEIINSDENQEENENIKKKNILMSSDEIEKLKSNDKKFIYEVNKKLIGKDKIIDIRNTNLVPDSIFTGRYNKIKKLEKIVHKIKNNRLAPLNLGKSNSTKHLGKEKLDILVY